MSIFEMADSILKLMDMNKKDAIKYMMSNHKQFKKCLKYIQATVLDLLPEKDLIQ